MLKKYERRKTQTLEEALKECLRQFNIEEEDRQKCLELIKKKDQSFQLMAKNERRKRFAEKVKKILGKFEQNEDRNKTFDEALK